MRNKKKIFRECEIVEKTNFFLKLQKCSFPKL